MTALQLEPDLIVFADGSSHTGSIVLDGERVSTGPAPHAQRVPLRGRWLVPAFVNAHSHAFQRALRGHVETRSLEHPDDDFWTWRAKMYETANGMSLDELERVARWAYGDMVASGFSAVGEFQYLHHDEDGAPYADPAEIPFRLQRAANDAGIRLVLLLTAYERAGPGKPRTDGQRRFVFDEVESFLDYARAVRAEMPASAHGLAIHSVRACSRAWIVAVAAEARRHGLPLHIHACEQRAEIDTCRDEHGVAPLALLDDAGALFSGTTIVHGTHLEPDDPERLARSGATVCICPSTERNLGDGLCPIYDLVAAGVPLAIGTDQHARIDVVDELRSLEDHERLRLMRRNVLTRPGLGLAPALFPIGTTQGASSLGLGALSADWAVIRAPVEGLVDAWIVGGSGRDVEQLYVAGKRVYPRP